MIYERKVLTHIEDYMDTTDIIVIHGARQVGKTTLMFSIKERLKGQEIPVDNIVYFDLEDFDLLTLCNDGPDAVVEHLKGIGCDLRKQAYLFIDEIQYMENPSSFLKLFHDRYKGKVKLVVSGSSSFAIKSKFKESLVGRTVDFELFGLDFEKMLVFKEMSFDITVKASVKIEKELRRFYIEYILYGGYPRIVLEDLVKRKETFLQQMRKNIDIENLHYWRTNKGQEVDFIITSGKGLIPIEVKTRFLPAKLSGLKYFLNAYSLKEGICTILDNGIKSSIDWIKTIPPWSLPAYVKG